MLTNRKILNSPFLTIFFYVPQLKRENIQILIKFFQTHRLTVERISEEKNLNPLSYWLRNANFVATGSNSLTNAEFERLASFLFSNVMIICLVYQNKIWNVSRLGTFAKESSLLTNQLSLFRKNLQNITL